MKDLMKKYVSLAIVFTLSAVLFTVYGQDSTAVVDTLPQPTIPIGPDSYGGLEAFTDAINWLYGILIIIAGYISKFIPKLKNIKLGVYRVLAVAIVIGLGFFVFDAQSTLFSLIITYTVSTSFYEVILKLFKKAPTQE